MDFYPFDRRVENRRIELSVTETAMYKGARRKSIIVAEKLLKKGFSLEEVAEVSELTTLEIQAMARGEDIDKEGED